MTHRQWLVPRGTAGRRQSSYRCLRHAGEHDQEGLSPSARRRDMFPPPCLF